MTDLPKGYAVFGDSKEFEFLSWYVCMSDISFCPIIFCANTRFFPWTDSKFIESFRLSDELK